MQWVSVVCMYERGISGVGEWELWWLSGAQLESLL